MDDNGKGISQTELKEIFKPYYRMHTKTGEDGLGIGLYLVKSIVDSFDSRIEVKSEVGKGTSFTVILPKYNLTKNDDVTEFTPGDVINRTKIVLSKEIYIADKSSIFIVEDNLQLLSYLQESLLPDYNVFYATCGQEALDKIIQMPKPDIIISDIMMGEMDGHEFYSRISKDIRYNDIPFVFLTSKSGKNEKLDSLRDGVIDYITKPFDIEELKAKIQSILENRNITKKTESNKIKKQINELLIKKADLKFLSFEKKCKEYKISPKEKEVVILLLEGFEMKEIAGKLFLSTHTIRNHIRSVYEKCKVHNRVELVNFFRE